MRPSLEAIYSRKVHSVWEFCSKPALCAKFGRKEIWKAWNERDPAILFQNTIRFLFWLVKAGLGKEGPRLHWHTVALRRPSRLSLRCLQLYLCKRDHQSPRGHGQHHTHATATLPICWPGFWVRISEFLPRPFSWRCAAKWITPGSFQTAYTYAFPYQQGSRMPLLWTHTQ